MNQKNMPMEELPPLPAEEDNALPPLESTENLPPLPAEDGAPDSAADVSLPPPPADDELPLPPPPAATLAPEPAVATAPATPVPAGKNSAGKLPLILAAGLCLGGFGIYMATSGSGSGDAAVSGSQAVAAETISPEKAVEMLQTYGIIDQFAAGDIVTTQKFDSSGSRMGKSYKENPIKGISEDLLRHFAMYKDGVEQLHEYPYIDKILELYRRANTVQSELQAQGVAKMSDDLNEAKAAMANALLGNTTEEPKQQTLKKLPVQCLQAFAAKGVVIANVETCRSNIFDVDPLDKNLIAFIYMHCAATSPNQVNLANGNGWTQLMNAARYSTVEVCQKLIAAGARVNDKNADGMTALMLAAFNEENPDIVDVLIKAGADVNAKNNNGWTPLMYMVRHSSVENVKKLIAAKAELEEKDKSGWTPLMLAARYRTVEMCQCLVDSGADIKATNNWGGTPFSLSCRNTEHTDVFDWFLEKDGDVHHKDKDGESLLLSASIVGNEYVCLKLIKAGVDVNAENNDALTPLMSAIVGGYSKIAYLLIDAGANVNHTDNPITEVALIGDAELFDRMVAAGAKVNVKNSQGMPILHIAAAYGNDQICAKLVAAGVDCWEKFKGKTPLEYAYGVRKDLLNPFVEKKVKETIRRGKCRFDATIEILEKAEKEAKKKREQEAEEKRKQEEEAKRKREAEMRQNTEYVTHRTSSSEEDETDSDSDDDDELGELIRDLELTSYNTAVEKLYQKRLLQLLPLIRGGAPVDVGLPDMNGTTALHNACGLSRVDIVRWLVDHGANLDARTAKGASVETCVGGSNAAAISQILREARQGRRGTPSSAGGANERAELQPFINEIVSMRTSNSTMQLYQKRLSTLLPMIRDGADVDVSPVEMKGNTALHYACGMGNYELVQWLVEHGADVNKRTNKGASPLNCVGGANGAQIRSLLIQHGAVK